MKKTLGLADKVEHLDRGLARANLPHAFGGALALAYYATPRATVDIDVNVFVPADQHQAVATVLRRVGADTIPDQARATRDGQVRAWWGPTPIDVFYAYDEVHEAMRSNVRTVPFGDASIPILAPEHLLVAKAVFDRPKDWLDIEQMLTAVGDLDTIEVRRWMMHLVGDADARYARVESLIERTTG